MPPAFVGAFATLCEMVIDVVSVTVCATGAGGGACWRRSWKRMWGSGPGIGDEPVGFGFGFVLFLAAGFP